MPDEEPTIEQLEQRIADMERELRALREELWRRQGYDVIPGIGRIGQYKNDPHFLEAARLGKAYRDKVNRQSLKEFDRARKREAKAKKRKK